MCALYRFLHFLATVSLPWCLVIAADQATRVLCFQYHYFTVLCSNFILYCSTC